MRIERWEELKEQMRSTKMVVDEEIIHEDQKTTEVLVVETPLGKIKFEFTVKPRFLGTTTRYSNRIGGSIDVKPQYSQDETVTVFDVYQWNDSGNRWETMDPTKLGIPPQS